MRHVFAKGLLAISVALVATGTLADNPDVFAAPEVKSASPFEDAQSGAKAKRGAKATAAGAKVIGGELAAEGAWPWQVALVVAGTPVSTDSQFCGGSLVLDTWVLTAAHCVNMQDDDGSFYDVEPGQFEVLVGSNELAPGKGEVIAVEKIIKHPSYIGDIFDFDIALIKLARAPRVPYQTVEVPDAEYGDILNQQGVTTIVTGWGLQDGAQPSPELRQAQIQILDRDTCNASMMEAKAADAVDGFIYAAQTLGIGEDDALEVWDEMVARAPDDLTENLICSGTFEGGKTSCNGDSGGPLVVPLEEGGYIQAGIVSWGLTATSGYGCEETALFSAYTDVSKFVPWLNEVIAANP